MTLISQFTKHTLRRIFKKNIMVLSRIVTLVLAYMVRMVDHMTIFCEDNKEGALDNLWRKSSFI